jgi:O-antigen/teichoic acid export membrane protein
MSFFKLSTPAIANEARAAAEVFSALFGVSLVSNGLLRILMGQQRAYEAQLISIGSTLLSGITVFCALRQGIHVGTLLVAGFGTQCATTMIVVLALLWFRGLLDVRIIWRSMRQQGSAVLASGSLFFFLQIGTMIGWGGDALLVASMSGALDVAAFAVAQRLFQFASQPVAVMNAALWPAYADAHAIADRGFLRATFRRSLTLSLVLGVGLSSLLLIASPWIVPYWTKKSIPVPGMLLAAFAAWTCVEAGGNALGIYLNGVGIARAQVIVFGSFCVVAIPAKLWGVTHGGPTGLLIATTLSYLATVVLLYSTLFRRVITAPMRQAS